VLAGEVVEIEQHIEVVGDLRDRFGPLRAIGRSERLRGLLGVVAVFGVVYLCWMSTNTDSRGMVLGSQALCPRYPQNERERFSRNRYKTALTHTPCR
jgi:hypothetical protein